MSIQLIDTKLIQEIEAVVKQEQRTPEEIIASALEAYRQQRQKTQPLTFWEAITGLGASGDPDIASRDEEILRAEVDPVHGWHTPDR